MAEQNTTDKLTLAKFEEAYDIVHKVVLPTKLIYSDYFSGITGKLSLLPMNPSGNECLAAFGVAIVFIVMMISVSSVVFQKRDI